MQITTINTDDCTIETFWILIKQFLIQATEAEMIGEGIQPQPFDELDRAASQVISLKNKDDVFYSKFFGLDMKPLIGLEPDLIDRKSVV